MSSRIHRQTARYLSVLIAVIALSACGEKKDVRGPQAPAQPKKVEEATPLSGGGLEVPLPAPGTSPTPTPTPVSETLIDPLEDNAGYDPVDPKQIERTDLDKRYTGLEDDDGLFYTGASTDYLLTYLRLRNEDPNLDDYIKTNNKNAAQSIESARLNFDQSTGDLTISLKIREGNDLLKDYTLAGGVSEDDRVSSLRISKSNSRGKTTGKQRIEGKIKCLDLHGSCETSYARILIGEPGDRAVVGIIFRQSLADYHIKLQSDRSGNPEYEFIRRFWLNTNDDITTHHRLKNIYLNSFEVVNGRSGFDVQVLGRGRQLLSFGGPLLAPDAGSSVSITADRTPRVTESLDLDSLNDYDYTMADYIGSAKIVNNNGLGQVRIAVKMRKRGGYAQDTWVMTVMRIIKPTVTPNEENLRMD